MAALWKLTIVYSTNVNIFLCHSFTYFRASKKKKKKIKGIFYRKNSITEISRGSK